MNYMTHCKTSARKYGGKPSDYVKIHKWLDKSKNHVADLRHRVVLHNAFGIELCVDVFGDTITNSNGKSVPVRKIAEDHVIEDQGFIPTLGEALAHTPITDIQAPLLRRAVGAYEKAMRERKANKQECAVVADDE